MAGSNIKLLSGYLAQHVKGLSLVLISLLSVSLSLLAIGVVLQNLIDQGLVMQHTQQVHNAIYLITLLILVFSIGSFVRSYFINMIALKVASQLKSDSYANLLKIDIVNFENLKIGELLSCLSLDIVEIRNLITNFLSFFIRNSIMLSGAIILMFAQSAKLSLLTIFAIPILLLPLQKLSKHVKHLSKIALKDQGTIASYIEENLTGIRTLVSYNQQDYSSIKFNDKIKMYVSHECTKLKFRSLFFALAIMVIATAITSVIWVGSLDILNGSISSGKMISFIYYAIIAGMSAGGIAELFGEVQQPLAALDRVLNLQSLYNTYPKNIVSTPKKIHFTNAYSIKFEHVSFAYPARKDIQILNDISFDIQDGKFSALVGKSGSGKSTLLQILLKFYKFQSGNIYLGNQSINNLNSDILRSKIAYVEQHPTIFSGTIRSNIALSKPNCTAKELSEVVKICGILDFTQKLEQGLDSVIGEKGVRLSGGQKQRIAVARALLYDPQILLLDEATSALDSDSEKKILQAIKTRLQEKTIVSIAHRLSSIENADEILVIDDGKITNVGTHSELIKNSQIYNILYSEEKRNV